MLQSFHFTSPRFGVAALVLIASSMLVPGVPRIAREAEIVFADGRRETVVEPRKDAKGRWMATRDGHRTPLKPGDVVVIVDEAGKETVTIPPLEEGPAPPESAAELASLCDPKNEAWREAAEKLATKPTRGLLDALVALTGDAKKETRGRAITALAELRTKESVTAATTAILAEKDAALHRDISSVLFTVQEIFKRCDASKSMTAGLADKEPIVRVAFAMISPPDLDAANAVLKNDGLKHSDHHVRESAAMELGQRGDAAGESLLIEMLARTKLPELKAGPETEERVLIKEQVEICSILGKLATERGKAALKKATASKFEAVKKAAEAALAGTANK